VGQHHFLGNQSYERILGKEGLLLNPDWKGFQAILVGENHLSSFGPDTSSENELVSRPLAFCHGLLPFSHRKDSLARQIKS